MYCATCGQPTVDGASFCPHCGAPTSSRPAARQRRSVWRMLAWIGGGVVGAFVVLLLLLMTATYIHAPTAVAHPASVAAPSGSSAGRSAGTGPARLPEAVGRVTRIAV